MIVLPANEVKTNRRFFLLLCSSKNSRLIFCSLTLLNINGDDSSSAELLYVTIKNLNASHVNSASENFLLLTVTDFKVIADLNRKILLPLNGFINVKTGLTYRSKKVENEGILLSLVLLGIITVQNLDFFY